MRQSILSLLLFLSFACTSQTIVHTAGTTTVEIQIIIGFANENINPETPALIASIANQLGTGLIFARRISGNAAVYKLQLKHPQEYLLEKLQQLAQRDDIRYAEIDEQRSIQRRAY